MRAKILLPVLMTMFVAGGTMLAVDSMAAADQAPAAKCGCPADKCSCPPGKCGCAAGECGQSNGCAGTAMTPEKRENVKKLFEESEGRLQPMRDDLFVKRQELKALQGAATPDAAAVKAKAEEIVALQNKMRAERKELGLKLDKELGLKPGTHDFSKKGMGRGGCPAMNRDMGKGGCPAGRPAPKNM